MNIAELTKVIQNSIHDFFHSAYGIIKPGLDYLKANVPDEAIKLAEEALKAAVAGTPWAALVDELIKLAEGENISLKPESATVALNLAQNNLIATGTPHLVATA